MESNSRGSTLLLRGPQVAKELSISVALAYRWMQSGVLPTIRVPGSRSIRVPREALFEWIRQNTRSRGDSVMREVS